MSGSSSEIRKSLVLSHLASKGNEREDTLGGKPEVALGVCEDLLDGSGVDDGGNERVHAAVKKLAGIGVHTADDGDARDAGTAAAGRDAGDHLAVGGLPVGVALARDAQAATGTYTDIGKVYQRIIFDCTSTPSVQDVIDVFSSFISDDISDFNTATYYCNPSYLYHSYKAGKLLD